MKVLCNLLHTFVLVIDGMFEINLNLPALYIQAHAIPESRLIWVWLSLMFSAVAIWPGRQDHSLGPHWPQLLCQYSSKFLSACFIEAGTVDTGQGCTIQSNINILCPEPDICLGHCGGLSYGRVGTAFNFGRNWNPREISVKRFNDTNLSKGFQDIKK